MWRHLKFINSLLLSFGCLRIPVVSFLHLARTTQLGQCVGALGMESGAIRDEDIAASSSFDGASVGPHNARYNLPYNLWISSVIAQSLRSKPKERNYRNKFKTQKMGVERFLIPSVWNWMKNISNWTNDHECHAIFFRRLFFPLHCMVMKILSARK